MIKKLSIYDLSEIAKAGKIDSFAFKELEESPEMGLVTIKNFRSKIETNLKHYDQRWVVLCDGDITELTEWASRMRLVRTKLDEMDRHLAVANTRLFNWNLVISIMGFVNAFRVAVEQTLDFNDPVAA